MLKNKHNLYQNYSYSLVTYFNEKDDSLCIIANNNDEAKYLVNELKLFLENDNIIHFKESDILPYDHFSVPEKITSSIVDVRIDLYDVSPIAHLRASTRFDLPHPLGPTTPVNPFPMLTSTGSTNDLKLEMRSFLKSTFSSLFNFV